jgi:hypothetical protein
VSVDEVAQIHAQRCYAGGIEPEHVVPADAAAETDVVAKLSLRLEGKRR